MLKKNLANSIEMKEQVEQLQDKPSEETAIGGEIGTETRKKVTNLANSMEMKELVEQSQDKTF